MKAVLLVLIISAVLTVTAINGSYAADDQSHDPNVVSADTHSSEHTEEEHGSADSIEHESADAAEHGANEHETSTHEHLHEEQEGPHVHNSVTAEAAQWIGISTLVAAPILYGITSKTDRAYRYVVLTLSVGAGVMHLLLVSDHMVDVSYEHAKYFAISGAAQVGFGVLYMLRASRRFAVTGIVGNIGSIALYWVTRMADLPAPLGAPEGVDSVGIVAKIVEFSLVGVLLYVLLRKKVKPVEASRV